MHHHTTRHTTRKGFYLLSLTLSLLLSLSLFSHKYIQKTGLLQRACKPQGLRDTTHTNQYPQKKYTILIFQARKENTQKNERQRKERKGGGRKNNDNNKGDGTVPCKFYTSCELHYVLSGSVSSSLKKPKKKRREKENNDNNDNDNHFPLLLLGGSKIIDATCTEKGPCVQVPLVYLLQIRCSDPLSLPLSLSVQRARCGARG
jgi:hypothetical protein